MKSNTKAVLCYVFPVVAGIIFLAIEKKDEFVRKCAGQSLVFYGFYLLLSLSLELIPFIGHIMGVLFKLCYLVLWVALIVKAAKKTYFKLPVIGDLSEKYILPLFNN